MLSKDIVHMLPEHLIPIILQYDGRIKYRKGEYVNIIHPLDERYSMIENIICKKLHILEDAEIYYDDNVNKTGHQFYFEFSFDSCRNVGLCFDYNFTYKNKFEVCYYDTRDGWNQIRTYI